VPEVDHADNHIRSPTTPKTALRPMSTPRISPEAFVAARRSAFGVALVIAIMNTDHSNAVIQFHRGWWFIAATFAAASTVYLLYSAWPKKG
jgi:hypothetical protein